MLVILCTLPTQTSLAARLDPIINNSILPIAQGLGLPNAQPSRVLSSGEFEIISTGQIQSHANDASGDNEGLILDGEVHSTGLALRWGLGRRIELNANVNYIRYTAGQLDALIDGWHDTFGLNDGDRPIFERDQLQFLYVDDDGVQSFDTAQEGVSDLQLGVAYQLLRRDSINLTAHFNANLPTGSSEPLIGSDQADFAGSLAFSHVIGRFAWHANAGWLAIGDDTSFGITTESGTWFSSIGGHWVPGERWRLTVQFDGHGAFFDSTVDEINRSAFQLAMSGELNLKRARIQLYFTEDISINRAADFGVGINFIWRGFSANTN